MRWDEMESQDVRLARLEEAMVSVKGDTRYIRDRLDTFSWRVMGLSGSVSVLVALLTAIVTKGMIK